MVKKRTPPKSYFFNVFGDFSDVARTIFVDFPRFLVPKKWSPERLFKEVCVRSIFDAIFACFVAEKRETKKHNFLNSYGVLNTNSGRKYEIVFFNLVLRLIHTTLL